MIQIHRAISANTRCGECGQPRRKCRCFQQYTKLYTELHPDQDGDAPQRTGKTRNKRRGMGRDGKPTFSLR